MSSIESISDIVSTEEYDKDGVMGMTSPGFRGEKEPENIGVIEEPQKEQIKQIEGVSIEDLFNSKDVELLLKHENDSEAQLAAMVLLSDGYSVFNVRNRDHQEALKSIDIESVSSGLGLDSVDKEKIESKIKELSDDFAEYRLISRRRYEISDFYGYEYDDEFKEVCEKEQALARTMKKNYGELMLPFRKAVLNSDQTPNEYKQTVVRGIMTHEENLDVGEADLLKEYYPKASLEVKEQIARTTTHNIGRNIEYFDTVPLEDLRTLGIDIDRFFIATVGNKNVTQSFVEDKVGPFFFPEENPVKVGKCWDCLKKVTYLEDNYAIESSFASDGINYKTNLMNIDLFGNFMENSDELIPVVNVLSEYGFRYVPVTTYDGKFFPEYVTALKKIGENIDDLTRDLDAIRNVSPDYKYRLVIDSRNRETTRSYETYVEDNPFSMALKQQIYPYNLETIDKFNQASQLFSSLQESVPERWRAGFIATYVDMMSKVANSKNISKSVTSRAAGECVKCMFDESLTSDYVELFATDLFKALLDPRNEKVRTAFSFCEKHADKIRTSFEGESNVDSDFTWYNFSLLASDIYRYPIVSGNEDSALSRTGLDITYAIDAVDKITNPKIKDMAISNIIYSLTDEEVGDLDFAQYLAEKIGDEKIKEDALVEIRLEKERQSRGETTTWKKMEKVRSSSDINNQMIRGLFGYSPVEKFQEVQARYNEVSKSNKILSPQALYTDERGSRLDQEVERITPNFRVTINATWQRVVKLLDEGRVISVWENDEVMDLRNHTVGYNYGDRRNEIERLMCNRAKGCMKDPHPIYGAAASPNGRDEWYGGTGGSYGECFVVLNEKIKDRTSFVYDDSFDGYHDWVLDWNGGIVAKAIHNLNNGNSTHRYVEAQILGGVRIEDIESINIPSDALYKKNKYGFSSEQDDGIDVLKQIEELRKRYPGIKINIIEVPDNKDEF